MKRLTVCVLATLVLIGCGKKNQDQQVQVPEVKTMVLENQHCDVPLRLPAQLKGKQDIAILPQVSGTLQQVLVQEGEHVTKGQLMFVIDPATYEAAVESAEAAVKLAEANLGTQQLEESAKHTLLKKNIISEHEYKVQVNALNIAEAQLREAKAQLKKARTDLSYTRILAPHTGVVGSINYKQGALVAPQMENPITMVSDNSTIYAYASINEKLYMEMVYSFGSVDTMIARLPEFQLVLGEDTYYPKSGRLETMTGMIDQHTGTVTVRIAFPNEQGLLASGGSGKVEIKYAYDGVVIPRNATFEIQNKTFVYMVHPMDSTQSRWTIESVEIEPYRLNETEFIVMKGLNEKDQIVKEGVRKLNNGQEIKPCN